jgi:hypothetical protein
MIDNNLLPIIFTYNQYNELNRILNNIIESSDLNPIRILSEYYDITYDNKRNYFDYVNVKSLNEILPKSNIFLIIKNPELCLLYRYQDKDIKRYYTVDLKSGFTNEITTLGFDVLSTIIGKDRYREKFIEKNLNDISKLEISKFYEKVKQTMEALDNVNVKDNSITEQKTISKLEDSSYMTFY